MRSLELFASDVMPQFAVRRKQEARREAPQAHHHRRGDAPRGRRGVDPVHRVAIVLAVIENPWAGRGFVDDLAPLIDEVAPELGALLAPRCVEALGVPAEAYGKAAVVGLDGELEHGSGLIHTLKFGNHFRDAANATTLLPAVEKVGARRR